MIDGVLSTADLLRATGYTSVGVMRRRLEAQGIRLFEGKDGPWTTTQLLREAGQPQSERGERYSVDML